MSKVLITGANGFIGSHLVAKFIAEGHEVFGLVRKSSDLALLAGKDVALRYGDITDLPGLNKHFAGMDIVVHNAGLASDWGSLELFRSINLAGTRNVARAAEENGVSRMVQMSSTAIHGFEHDHPVSEDDPLNPVFNYSISKMEAEQWLFDYAKESRVEITAIRPGNVFGPDDHTFIEKYIQALQTGKIAYINGGKSLTCPTYIGNLTDAVYLAAFHPDAVNEAFIITDGLDINWQQFTEEITGKLGLKKPWLSIPLGFALGLAAVVEGLYKMVGSRSAPFITKYRVYNGGTDYHFSIEKAQTVLGFTPRSGLQESMTQTIIWFKDKYRLS